MTITAYGVLHAAGVAVGVAIVFACAERRGVGTVRTAALTFLSFAAAFASAWLAGRLLVEDRGHSGAWSGLGFPVCLAAGWLLAHLGRMPVAFVDACAVGLPLALALGRIGCFAAGCCGGGAASGCITCDRLRSVPPTQLYDAAMLLAAAPLVLLAWRRGHPGTATAAFLAAFGASRFVTSHWRAGLHPIEWGLNADQFADSLAILLAAAIWAASRPSPRLSRGASPSRTSAP